MRITANLFECAKISNGLKLFAKSLQCHQRLQIMQLCNEPTYKCVTCMHTIVYRLDLSMKGHNVLTYSCQVPFSSLARKLTLMGTDTISYILFLIRLVIIFLIGQSIGIMILHRYWALKIEIYTKSMKNGA